MPINWLLMGLQSLLTTVSILLALGIGFKLLKPRLNRLINDKIHLAEARVTTAIPKILEKTVENIDVGEIMGKLGGESESGGLGAIQGLLSGGSKGGLGDLLQLLSSFSGVDQSKGKGKMGL